MARVHAVEGAVGTGCRSRLIAAVRAVTIVVIDLRVLDGPQAIKAHKRLAGRIEAGPGYGEAAGSRNSVTENVN